MDTDHLRWEVLQRYRYIEIMAQWEGRLNTRHLCDTFGIKRQQASRDISEYRRMHPNNLEYDPHAKGYRPTASFLPRFTAGTVDEYLHMLGHQSLLTHYVERVRLPSTPTLMLNPPGRRADPDTVRALVTACRQGRRLELTYSSMNHPAGEERIISPHTLVFSGYRWHVRAWCEKNRDFRDFLISRIRSVQGLLNGSLMADSSDEAWHTWITLKLRANPALDPAQQELIRFEREFEGAALQVETRAATAIYLLQYLQVGLGTQAESAAAASPRAWPLVLTNPEVIRGLEFDGAGQWAAG